MSATPLPSTGRPVDVEIVPRAHALLSASSAERWLTCTPSARIEEALPDRGSSYATDGTAAHAFAELRLRYLLGQTTKAEYVAAYEATKVLHAEVIEQWTHEDWEAIDSYVEYVLERKEELGGDDCEVIIEARVDYSRYAEGGFGTSDALLVSGNLGIIEAIDLKFGKGVPVSAIKNSQAKLYTAGGFLGLPREVQRKIKTFRWAIVQPRLSYVGTDECSADEMKDWLENTVQPAAALAWEGKGKLVPSEKGCQFCKARSTCRARASENILLAQRDFTKHMDADGKFNIDLDETQMTFEEMAKLLPQLDQFIAWANDMKARALVEVRDNGQSIPGYKLVRGRSIRQWDATKDIAEELRKLGLSDPEIFEPPKPPQPKSVAQLEKAMGKKNFTPIEETLVVKPLGTPALVPSDDPRDAIDKAAEAAKDFE